MNELAELYQQVVLDHGKRPRNLRAIDDATRIAEGYNPLCGDKVKVYIKFDDQMLSDVSFTGQGCAICTASASLMTQHMKGKRQEDAEAIFQQIHDMLAGSEDANGVEADLGKLTVLAGVKQYPIRVKCATLPWHTLHAALKNQDEPVSTE